MNPNGLFIAGECEGKTEALWVRQCNVLKVCLHMTSFSPFNASFNGPFFTVSIVFMKNGQNGF